ncbi:glutamine amidotransferase [Microbacterium soli]|uniref:Lipid II isoglutaminyl synthase (glutamine-hydrolyzing) subunit GatD n=1 Tax=Microbacterium soli TaxID=446075 RepID=A0ABP7NHQ9_9MICO
MTRITIAQLYPDLLGVTGDRGNVRALEARLELADVNRVTHRIAVGEELPDEVDILVIGNGPLSAMRAVHADLTARADRIRSHVEDGGALLAVGGGAELLSRGVTTLDGERLDGLGVLDATVARTRTRKVGYIIADTEIGRVIGFEDHASEWTLADHALGYGRVAFGQGGFALPAEADGHPVRGEMLRVGNAFATTIQGPVLPLNPGLTREILTAVCARRGTDVDLTAGAETLDAYAAGARTAIEALVHGKGFNTIQL